MSYMQLISAVRCHRFKGLGGGPIVPLLTQMSIIFILQVIGQWKVLI